MMEFKVALATVCKNRVSDSEITEPFTLYSRLSDLCSASYGAKERLLLFYQIDERLHVVQGLLAGRTDLYSMHHRVSDLVSESKFRSMLDMVKSVLASPSKVISSANKHLPPASHPQACAVKRAPTHSAKGQSTGFSPAKIWRSPQSNSKSATSTRFNQPSGGAVEFILGATVILAIILFFAALIFGWGWTFWQWYIGLVVCPAASLFIALFPFLDSVGDELFYYAFSLISASVLSVVGFVLCAIFGADFKIIFGCLSATLLMVSGILTLCSYGSTVKEVARLTPYNAICFVTTLVFTVIGITWF